MGKRRRKRVSCSNCGKHLREEMNYCFNCGQENHIKRVSMKMLISDFISTYFSADSKAFKTIKYLVTKPSFLSREYLDGKIETYLRPIRLYVFISFIYFILLGISSSNVFLEKTNNLDTISNQQNNDEDGKSVVEEGLAEDEELTIDFFGKDLTNKAKKVFTNKAEKNRFFNYLREKLPIVLFTIIPLLAALLFVFFYKKELLFIDHFVFALHLQTFLFVSLIVTSIINIGLDEDVGGFAFLATLIYGFIATKRFYKKSVISSVIRLIFTGFFHLLLVSLLIASYMLFMLNIYSI